MCTYARVTSGTPATSGSFGDCWWRLPPLKAAPCSLRPEERARRRDTVEGQIVADKTGLRWREMERTKAGADKGGAKMLLSAAQVFILSHLSPSTVTGSAADLRRFLSQLDTSFRASMLHPDSLAVWFALRCTGTRTRDEEKVYSTPTSPAIYCVEWQHQNQQETNQLSCLSNSSYAESLLDQPGQLPGSRPVSCLKDHDNGQKVTDQTPGGAH